MALLPAPTSVHGSCASPHTDSGPDVYLSSGFDPGHPRKLRHHCELLEASETALPCWVSHGPFVHTLTYTHVYIEVPSVCTLTHMHVCI